MKSCKKLICHAATLTAMLHLANKVIQHLALVKNLLPAADGHYYKSRFGNVFYTKCGTGSPLLLIHDLQPESSGYEWSTLRGKLAETYTVYTIDLPGCGRSDKTNIAYTSYLYVQLLEQFCKDVIGAPAAIAATGTSSTFVLHAASQTPAIAKRILLINPETFAKQVITPKEKAKLYRRLISLPVFGTCIYNYAMSLSNIQEKMQTKYFYKNTPALKKNTDAYYESAHIGGADAKYLYASIAAGYMDLPVSHILPKLSVPLMLLSGEQKSDAMEQINAYSRLRPDILVETIPDARQLPQLEQPRETYQLMHKFFG